MTTKAEQLQWRRSKVIEMRSRGLNQIEIAHELQVSKASISSDMQYLRKQAKESIKEYVTEHLPEQYQICLTALESIIKHTFEILQNSHDNREKLQAMELFKDTHLVKLELLSNATTIDSGSDHSEMLSVVWDLIQRYNVTKVLVDASAPSFIRALKLQWDERSDYENVDKHMREYMRVEPVSFGVEHKALLYHAKFLLENRYIQIHPTKFDKLITALRSAWAKDGVLDKEVTSHDDLVDAFRLALRPFKEQSTAMQ